MVGGANSTTNYELLCIFDGFSSSTTTTMSFEAYLWWEKMSITQE